MNFGPSDAQSFSFAGGNCCRLIKSTVSTTEEDEARAGEGKKDKKGGKKREGSKCSYCVFRLADSVKLKCQAVT